MWVGFYLLRLAHPEPTTCLSLQAIALTSYATLNSRSTTCWASESCRLPCKTDLPSCFSPSAETTGQDVSIESIEINLKNTKKLATMKSCFSKRLFVLEVRGGEGRVLYSKLFFLKNVRVQFWSKGLNTAESLDPCCAVALQLHVFLFFQKLHLPLQDRVKLLLLILVLPVTNYTVNLCQLEICSITCFLNM